MADTIQSIEDLLADAFDGSRLVVQQDIRDLIVSTGGRETHEGTFTTALTSGARTKLTGIDTFVNRKLGMEVWDTVSQKIQPEFLDADYHIRLMLDVDPPGGENILLVELDIGGAIGVVFEARSTTRSTDRKKVYFDIPVYCGSTFLANGGEFYVTADANGFSLEGAQIAIWRL